MSTEIPDVKQCDYRDMAGKLLWSEPMRFSRLDGIGDTLIHESVEYRVKRVAVADHVQHVNLFRTPR